MEKINLNNSAPLKVFGDIGGGDPGYEESTIVIDDETINAEENEYGGGGIANLSIGTDALNGFVGKPLKVIYDSTEYDLPYHEEYGGFWGAGDLSDTFVVYPSYDGETPPAIRTQTVGKFAIKILGTNVSVSSGFKSAVLSVAPKALKNVLDGKADGSVRTSGSAPEDDNYSLGRTAFAEGNYTRALGGSSHAEGDSTIAQGDESHAEGGETKALGDYSHSEGYLSTASGGSSHAEGSSTANGVHSHAEGSSTANGEYSHAEGSSTANGDYSHTEGYDSETRAIYSHAEGHGTRAVSANQHVQGKYNAYDADGTYAFIIGNGSGDSETSRSNAFAIKWDGTIVVWNNGTAVELTPAKLAQLVSQ